MQTIFVSAIFARMALVYFNRRGEHWMLGCCRMNICFFNRKPSFLFFQRARKRVDGDPNSSFGKTNLVFRERLLLHKKRFTGDLNQSNEPGNPENRGTEASRTCLSLELDAKKGDFN
jgi:hypothetical protein